MRPKSSSKLSLAAIGALVTFIGSANRAAGQCDPQERATLTAADAATGDEFGKRIALSADTVVIGAAGDDNAGGHDAGSAYVFVLAGGVWTQQAKLMALDAAADDTFSDDAVALAWDTAVIGAQRDDHAGGIDAGSAYVFVRSGGVWTQQAKLTASDAASGDHFGAAAAVSGDTAVIGAPWGDQPTGVDAGAAYVFVRSGDGWVPQAKLTAADLASGDQFGYTVAVDGDTAAVSAPTDDHASGDNAGSVYVFVRAGSAWFQQAKLTTADAADGDVLGSFVLVLAGDLMLVGAQGDDHDGAVDAGSVYLFARTGGIWTQQAKLTASGPASGDEFGHTAAIFGDTIIVGTGRAGASNTGAAYVFVKPPGGWKNMTETVKLTAADASDDDQFGVGVGLSGDMALVAAHLDDHAGMIDAGSVRVFDLHCQGPCGDAAWSSYGSGWPGTNGVPSLTSSDPILCTVITLDLGNSLGANTTAALIIGLAQTDQPTLYDGHLLVVPTSVVLLSVPSGGIALPGFLPCDYSLCGLAVYLQALEVDPGASKGISFTSGLQLVLGT